MTRQCRRSLFYGFCGLFILVSLGVVLYVNGWRLDSTENCSIYKFWTCKPQLVKTGAIFIQTNPKGVDIKIDGRSFQDKSGLIQNGTLIPDLTPKIYKVSVKKDGYLEWLKNLKVKSGLVAEALNIVLVPKEINKDEVLSEDGIQNFLIGPGDNIVLKINSSFYWWDGKNIIKLRGDNFIGWSSNGNEAIIKDSKSGTFYLNTLSIPKAAITNINLLFENLKEQQFNDFKRAVIKAVEGHPFNNDRLIVETQNGLFILDMSKLSIESIFGKEVSAWNLKNPNLYFSDKKGNLYSFNLIIKSLAQLDGKLQTANLSNILKIEVSPSNLREAALDSNGRLSVFDQGKDEWKHISDNVATMAFSPDNKKIAAVKSGGQLEIYFLDDTFDGLNKKTGETSYLNLENKSGIKDIYWYKDSLHLLVNYGNYLALTEIDDRPPLNVHTLMDGLTNSYYNSQNNVIFVLLGNKLYKTSL